MGTHVGLRRSLIPGGPERVDEGTVVRSDARGVVVRLASGDTTICEPNMLTLIAPLPDDQ